LAIYDCRLLIDSSEFNLEVQHTYELLNCTLQLNSPNPIKGQSFAGISELLDKAGLYYPQCGAEARVEYRAWKFNFQYGLPFASLGEMHGSLMNFTR